MELKQLEYFVACAETGSLRKAAQVLYTTQSNVSKVIQALEHDLGTTLLKRTKNGATLTDQGAAIYEQAKRTLECARHITHLVDDSGGKHLSILSNPSSWINRAFRLYYQHRKESETRYSVITASTNDIIKSLAANGADIGFVYVMEQQVSSVQAQLVKNHLVFAPLTRTGACLYRKTTDSEASENSQVCLIQGYEDELALKSCWSSYQANTNNLVSYHVSVFTNSDSLKAEMLEHTALGSIEFGLSQQYQRYEGMEALPLLQEEASIIFGFICNNDQPLSNEALDFLHFIKGKLSKNDLRR